MMQPATQFIRIENMCVAMVERTAESQQFPSLQACQESQDDLEHGKCEGGPSCTTANASLRRRRADSATPTLRD